MPVDVNFKSVCLNDVDFSLGRYNFLHPHFGHFFNGGAITISFTFWGFQYECPLPVRGGISTLLDCICEERDRLFRQ